MTESRVGMRWLVGVWSVVCLGIAGALGLSQQGLLTALARVQTEKRELSEDLTRLQNEQAERLRADSGRIQAAAERHAALVERLRDKPSGPLRARAAALGEALLPSAGQPRRPDQTAVEETLEALLASIRLRERCLEAGVAVIDSRQISIASAEDRASGLAELDADLDAAVALATISGRSMLARRLIDAAAGTSRDQLERSRARLQRQRGDAYEARARALVSAVAKLPRDGEGAERLRALAEEAAALDDPGALRLIEGVLSTTAAAVAERAKGGREAWRPVERDQVSFALAALARAGRPESAIKVISRFLTSCRDGELQLQAGKALCHIARLTPADSRLDSGVDALAPLLELGRQVGFAGPVWTALTPRLKSLPSKPSKGRSPLATGVLALLKGQNEVALERLDAALKAEPGNAEARRLKVRALLALGRHEAAAKVARQSLEDSSADDDRRLYALALIGLDQSPEALKVLDVAHEARTLDARIELLRAQLLRESDRLLDARKAIERALRMDSESSAAWFEYARLQRVSQAPEKAHDSASRGLRLDRENIAGLLLRSRIRRDLRQWGPAMDDLSLILSLEPTQPEALRERGLLFAALGRFGDARRDLDALVKAHPESGDSFLARAAYFGMRGQNEPALQDIREALTWNPSLAKALAARADIHLRMRRLKEAEMAIGAALDMAADSKRPKSAPRPDARTTASWKLIQARIRWSLGQLPGALDSARDALALDPSSGTAGELCGHIAERLGFHKEALAACRAALKAEVASLGHSHDSGAHSTGDHSHESGAGQTHSHGGSTHSHGDGGEHTHDKHDHGEGPHSHDAISRLRAAVARLERRLALISKAEADPESRRALFRAELERARRAPPIFAADPLRRACGCLETGKTPAVGAPGSPLEAKRRRELARVAADRGYLDLALELRRLDLPINPGSERSRALVELAAILLRGAGAKTLAPSRLGQDPETWLEAFKSWHLELQKRGRTTILAERRQRLKERALRLLREAAEHPPGVDLADRKDFRMLFGEPGWAKLTQALGATGEAGPAGPPAPEKATEKATEEAPEKAPEQASEPIPDKPAKTNEKAAPEPEDSKAAEGSSNDRAGS